ncbi:hypothetical protein DPX39_020025300 [Trypanosoma brucei equiperdum]|uniref:Present in the outer mitochondrial membrane proteome 22 n=1 Tax=Trypanosoma brucei equiperdum TaxID=630700 RepID=A0A3L6LEL9_9TRYP|nr:hypothetical protein DPX39_020025300 [Trypanosoma brucei equiperdum]
MMRKNLNSNDVSQPHSTTTLDTNPASYGTVRNPLHSVVGPTGYGAQPPISSPATWVNNHSAAFAAQGLGPHCGAPGGRPFPVVRGSTNRGDSYTELQCPVAGPGPTNPYGNRTAIDKLPGLEGGRFDCGVAGQRCGPLLGVSGDLYGVTGISNSTSRGNDRHNGSMYGTNPTYSKTSRTGSMYGMGSMYGRTSRIGSMYGRTSRIGSMYGMGSMYGRASRTGSMYGMGSMYGRTSGTGSMYGMGSIYGMGSMYGRTSRTGSMYGPRMEYGPIYGVGGPMGSMYGPQMGYAPIYGVGGPMGSMYGPQMGYGPIYCVGPMYGRPSRTDSVYGPQMGHGPMYCVGGLLYSKAFQEGDPGRGSTVPKSAPCNSSTPSAGVTTKPDAEPDREEKEPRVTGGKKPTTFTNKGPAAETAEKPCDLDSGNGKVKHSPVAQVPPDNSVRTLMVVSSEAGPQVTIKEEERKVGVASSGEEVVYYEGDEVVHGDEITVEKSALLQMIVQQVELGHNTALILSDSTPQQTLSACVTTSVMKSILAALRKGETENGTKYEVLATAADVPTIATARDLLAVESEAVKIARYGSNPMLGACLMDLQETVLRDDADVDVFVQEALKKSSGTAALGVMHATLKQIRKTSSAAPTVYVSSFVCLFVKDGVEHLQDLLDMNGKVVPLPLAKSVLGGGSCVVAVVGASGKDVAVDAKILSNTAALRGVKNTPPRSGNVARFVEFAETQFTECKAAIERSKEAAERERHERTLRRLEIMLSDARKLLSDPEETRAKVYPPSRESVKNGSVENDGRNVRNGASIEDDRPSAATLAPAPASADSLTAPKEQEVIGAPAPAHTTEPWEKTAKIIVTAGSGPSNGTAEVVAGGEKKTDEVDEYIQRTGVRPVDSVIAKRMEGILTQGYNVALLSAEMVPDEVTGDQVTWSLVKAILKGALSKKDGVTNECTLQMSILRGDKVVLDLLGSSEKRQLVVARSPIFGVTVQGATTKVVGSAVQVEPVLEAALMEAKDAFKDSGYIVFTAVLKQVTAADVSVSSLFVVSAPDMQPFVDALEKKETHPHALFAHALLGPCSCALLVSYRDVDDNVLKALDAHREITLKNNKQPGGSVRKFVGVVEQSITAAEEKLKSVDDAKERERHEQVLRDKKQALHDAQKLLEKPNETQPVAYVPSISQESGGADSTVRVVAVLTDKRDGKKRNVIAKDNGFTIKTSVEETEFPADEVVRRIGQAAKIRSSSVDFLIDHFVKGYNVALLTADVDGFSTGENLLEHTVRSVFTKKNADGELFVVLASIKADCCSAKDLQRDGATYDQLQCASSPLFGPCVADAKFELATAPDTLLQKVRSAIQVCEADKSTLLCLFVYKERKPADGDVFLSSFFFFLAGSRVDIYTQALEKRQKERGLFQYALGGPCLTAFALGVSTSNSDVETATAFVRLAKKVRGSKIGTIRTGGIQRFVAFSTKALEQLRVLQEKAPESDRGRLRESSANVEKVLADAEELLRNPEGRAPPLYKQER